MLLKELKDIVCNIDKKYDDLPLHSDMFEYEEIAISLQTILYWGCEHVDVSIQICD